jgi:GntR family transcriptional regulator
MAGTVDKLTKNFVAKYWNDSSNLSKHQKLKNAFVNAISDGYWTVGMRLPTESKLTELTPCSLGTVQRALRDLAVDCLIERHRGSGSVVADMNGKLSDPWHIRYENTEDGSSPYYELQTRFLSRVSSNAKGLWSTILDQGNEQITKIDRRFVVDGRIEIYSEFYTLSTRFPEFMELPTDKMDGLNFKKLIANRYKAPTQKVRQHLRFQKTPDHVANLCGRPAGGISPVLNVVAYTLSGEPIFYQDFFLPLKEGNLDLGVAVRGL